MSDITGPTDAPWPLHYRSYRPCSSVLDVHIMGEYEVSRPVEGLLRAPQGRASPVPPMPPLLPAPSGLPYASRNSHGTPVLWELPWNTCTHPPSWHPTFISSPVMASDIHTIPISMLCCLPPVYQQRVDLTVVCCVDLTVVCSLLHV